MKSLIPALALALSFVGSPTSALAEPATVFTGMRLIDGSGNRPIEKAVLVVRDGRIVAAGRVDPKPYLAKGGKAVDLSGKTVIPGLVSDHSHVGIVKGETMSPDNYTTENIGAALRQYEAYGVTAVLSLGVNKDLLYQFRTDQRAGKLGGADVFTADHGIGVPRAVPPLPGGADQIDRPATPEDARKLVRAAAARKPDLLKVWVDDVLGSLEPKMSPEIYTAVIDEAHKQGLRVAAHIFYLEDAKRLLRAGLDVVAHSVRDQPVDAEFISLMKKGDTARVPAYIATLALDEAQFIYAEHPAWMDSPAFRAAADPKLVESWLGEEYARKTKANPQTPRNRSALATAMRNVKILHDAGVYIGFGTDSGAMPTRLPGWMEHRELQLLVAAGLTPMQALVCATRKAAEVLGDAKNRGTLEIGKRADFVVLSANPLDDISNTLRLVAIYHGGKRIEPAFAADATPSATPGPSR